MALQSTLKLARNPNDQFGPHLATVLFQLIQDLTTLCDASQLSLEVIPAFQSTTNEWQLTLLQIYEGLLEADCAKQKLSKQATTFSRAFEPFIEFLHQRRVKLSQQQDSPETNFFKTRLAEINSRVQEPSKILKTEEILPNIKTKPATADMTSKKRLSTQTSGSIKASYSKIPRFQASPKEEQVKKKFSALGVEWPFKDQKILEQTTRLEQQIINKGSPREKSNSVGKRNRKQKLESVVNIKEELKTQAAIYNQFSERSASEHQIEYRNKRKQKKLHNFPLIVMDEGQGLGKMVLKPKESVPFQTGKDIVNQLNHLTNQRLHAVMATQTASLQLTAVQVTPSLLKEKPQKIKTQDAKNNFASSSSMGKLVSKTSQEGETNQSEASPIVIKPVHHVKKAHKRIQETIHKRLEDSEPVRASVVVEPKSAQNDESEQATKFEAKRLSLKPDLPSNFVKYEDGIKFNILGLINTQPDKSFYRVTASLIDDSHQFHDVDWTTTSTVQFRFKATQDRVFISATEDKVFTTDSTQLSQRGAIIYQILRYDQMTQKWDPNYAFAVQPVFQQADQQIYIISGQFQIPLFAGQAPDALFKSNTNPMKALKMLMSQKAVTTVDFVQMITRVSDLNCNDLYVRKWWPEVESSMQFVQIPEQYKLARYVLHAKHGSIDKESRNLSTQFGADFAEIWAAANK